MKRIFLTLILIIVLFNLNTFAYADIGNSYGYDVMVDFVINHSGRDAGTIDEYNAALYIENLFIDLGLQSYIDNEYLIDFEYINPYDKKTYTSYNVAGVLSGFNTNGEQIIIGAHYDNIYKPKGINITGGQGAYDNGSGIGALAQVAHQLKDKTLPVDVIFVAFGAEEMGLFGSRFMANNMTQEDIDNTILMINLDSISCGDYLYIYTDDVKTYHEHYMLEVAQSMNIDIKTAPKDKKAMPTPNEFSELNYSHTFFYSDHSSFMKVGIDVAFFVGYNFESGLLPPMESAIYPNIMHTTNDTLEETYSMYGEQINIRIDGVANLVTQIIMDEEIISVMNTSKESKYNYRWMANEKMANSISRVLRVLIVIAVFIVGQSLLNKEKKHKLIVLDDNSNKETYIFEDLGI